MIKNNRMTSIKAKFLALFLLLVPAQVVQARSAVYHLPLQRAFSPFPIDNYEDQCLYLAVGPFGRFKNESERHSDDKRFLEENRFSMGGAYFNGRYTFYNPFWFEVRTAVAHESHSFGDKECTSGWSCDNSCQTQSAETTNSADTARASVAETVVETAGYKKRGRSGFDDVILTLGSTWIVNDCVQLAPYIFGGIPTKTDLHEDDTWGTALGTRRYTFGGGCEGAFVLWNGEDAAFSMITNLRLYHNFSRDAYPLQKKGYRFHDGNQFDALVAGRYENYCFFVEGGYNPTVLFGQHLTDAKDKRVRGEDCEAITVSNLYLMGGYKSEVCGYPVALTLGGSYGIPHEGRHAKDGSVWLSGSIYF